MLLVKIQFPDSHDALICRFQYAFWRGMKEIGIGLQGIIHSSSIILISLNFITIKLASLFEAISKQIMYIFLLRQGIRNDKRQVAPAAGIN